MLKHKSNLQLWCHNLHYFDDQLLTSFHPPCLSFISPPWVFGVIAQPRYGPLLMWSKCVYVIGCAPFCNAQHKLRRKLGPQNDGSYTDIVFTKGKNYLSSIIILFDEFVLAEKLLIDQAFSFSVHLNLKNQLFAKQDHYKQIVCQENIKNRFLSIYKK